MQPLLCELCVGGFFTPAGTECTMIKLSNIKSSHLMSNVTLLYFSKLCHSRLSAPTHHSAFPYPSNDEYVHLVPVFFSAWVTWSERMTLSARITLPFHPALPSELLYKKIRARDVVVPSSATASHSFSYPAFAWFRSHYYPPIHPL